MYSGLSMWHLLILLAVLAVFALFIAAIVSIARAGLDSGPTALWIVVCLLFPLVGSIIWFAVGRRTATRGP